MSGNVCKLGINTHVIVHSGVLDLDQLKQRRQKMEIKPTDWNELCKLIEDEQYNQFYEELTKTGTMLEEMMSDVPEDADSLFTDEEAKTLVDAILYGDTKSEKHFRSGY